MHGIHLFKKYFIPGEHNDHKPHVLRTEATVFFLTVILLVEMIFLLQVAFIHPRLGNFAEVLPSIIAALTNDDRKADDLPGLQVNTILQKAAQMKADDMAAKGYFAHTSPEGVTPWYWIERAGYRYDYVGENLAVNFFDSSDVNQAWMDSVKHRENIMSANFTEIGIATARGVYEGKETVFIVQMFGRPAQIAETRERPKTVAIAQAKSRPRSTSTVDGQPGQLTAQGVASTSAGEVSGVSFGMTEAPLADPINPPAKVSAFKKMLSMPRMMNAYLYGVLLTIIALALTLKVFVKIRIQHVGLIANGAALLIIMTTALLVNQKIALLYANIV